MCAGFRDYLVGRGLSLWNSKEKWRKVQYNANAEKLPVQPTLQELHTSAERCLERPLDPAEKRRLDLAYSDAAEPADRSSLAVAAHRFEENWFDFLRTSTLGDGPCILERLAAAEGRFGTQEQLIADINQIPLAGSAFF